jgi:hypothetical protein
MGPAVCGPLHFSLPDALTVGMETMNMPARPLAKPSERQTNWSLALGITIWFLHLSLLNALTSVACKWDWLMTRIAGLTQLQIVALSVSLFVSLLMVLLIYLPYRYWRSFQTQKPMDNPELLRETEEDRRPLLAFITMLLNGFFSMFALATFVPILALKACGQG